MEKIRLAILGATGMAGREALLAREKEFNAEAKAEVPTIPPANNNHEILG